jgi:TatD DNase family protein
MRYHDDLEQVIIQAKEKGVEKFIIPGAAPESLERAVAISEQYAEVYFAVGVHPYDAKHYNRKYLEKFITHPKCVAVGECGLDYYRLPEDETSILAEKKLQAEVFRDQIALAKVFEKPLIVHIRDASSDAKSYLEKYAGEEGGVLHCYNADESLLTLVEKNFYYGIGGVLTFKNAKKLIHVYPKIPENRLLVETDAPYLTPHPYRGKRNEPAYCTFIVEKMCELSGVPLQTMASLTTENALRLFAL